MIWEYFGKFLAESGGDVFPDDGVVPDVGIGLVLVCDDAGCRDGFLAAIGFVAEGFEDFGHSAFEVESAVEDKLRVLNFFEVTRGWFVEVGVDAWAHEGFDFAEIGADILGEVGEHAGGG